MPSFANHGFEHYYSHSQLVFNWILFTDKPYINCTFFLFQTILGFFFQKWGGGGNFE